MKTLATHNAQAQQLAPRQDKASPTKPPGGRETEGQIHYKRGLGTLAERPARWLSNSVRPDNAGTQVHQEERE